MRAIPGDDDLGPLTLDDLSPDAVADARKAAQRLGLSWPPYLPEAEEYYLSHRAEVAEDDEFHAYFDCADETYQ